MKTYFRLFRTLYRPAAVLLLLALLLAACRQAPPVSQTPVSEAPTQAPPTAVPADMPTPAEAPATPDAPRPAAVPPAVVPVEVELRFATFSEAAVDVGPALAYEPIAPDLSNVRISYLLSPAQRERLARDGLVVSPGVEKEFFTIYEQARYANAPLFVTSDSVLHVYHLLFNKTLRTAEREYFIPLLRDLNAAMLAQTDAQYQALQGAGWEDAARRTVAFVAVAGRLLEPDFPVPAYAADLVTAELALVEAAAGIIPSPLFPGLEFGEDYTQYIPRGHYTLSDELKAYFRSMMWYGRMTFRLRTDDPDVGRAETRSALLLVHALRQAEIDGQPALTAWADLYNPTVFFVGRSDDLTVVQYAGVMDAVYGPNAPLAAVADDALLDTFIEEADELPPPRILGLVISETADVEETTKGLRFMGQRFVPDAYIFRQLIYRNVGTPQEPRMLPSGLDVMAALGSDRAYEILDEMGETAYQNYPQQMQKMQAWTAGLTEAEWTETLYNTWLYAFLPLLDPPGAAYPPFMRSTAWLDKQLNTALGSWAELKHDTILYAKQVYAEMGGGPMPPDPVPPTNYVEPVPHFYARLAALTTMTREGLAERGLLSARDEDSLLRLEDLVVALQEMAEKQLRGEPLTAAENDRLRFYGGELEHLTMAAADSDTDDPFAMPVAEEEPQAAVIADVATAPDPSRTGIPEPVVLEVGVGRINPIYVVVPVVAEDGRVSLQLAKGGVFSYYEFTWPANDRLTDEKWRAMLDSGTAPPLPAWTASFVTAETAYTPLQQGVFNFQRSLNYAFWTLNTRGVQATEAARDQLQPALDTLEAARRYEGRQLVNVNFRSFDFQAEDRAVVTVRETWQDTLYEYAAGEEPGWSGTRLAERGPYTLDATYTLLLEEGRWQVANVVWANEPPAWTE
jgi:hypothetical protein